MEHKIELTEGYTDKDGKRHTAVTFGKRLTTKDLIDLDNDPQAQNPTQYNDLIRRKMLTKFGDLKLPVPLNVLLALDSLDREDLNAGANEFVRLSRGERTSEIRENNEVKLFYGFEIDGTVYDVIEFGRLNTGRDAVEADALGNGIARECFLVGRQIVKISTSDGLASIEGAVDLEKFYTLDSEDFNVARIGAKMFEVTFRLKRESVSRKRNGDNGHSSGAGAANVGKRNSKSAAKPD